MAAGQSPNPADCKEPSMLHPLILSLQLDELLKGNPPGEIMDYF